MVLLDKLKVRLTVSAVKARYTEIERKQEVSTFIIGLLKKIPCVKCVLNGGKTVEVFDEKHQVGPANVSLGWTIKEVMECNILIKSSVWGAFYPFPWQLFPVKPKWSLQHLVWISILGQ